MLLLNGCSINDYNDDLCSINIFGKVKSIRERTYIADEKYGKISIGRQIDPIIENHSFYKEFNKDGFIQELINYDGEDAVKNSTKYKYDSENRLLKKKHYNSDGNLKKIVSYAYDAEHLESKYNITNDDTTSRIEYYYDGEGLLILTENYSNETLTFSTEWIITGNDTSKIVEKTTTFSDVDDQIYEKEITELGKIVFYESDIIANPSRITISISYTYSKFGNLIEKSRIEKRWLFGSVTETNYKYSYDIFDKKNNWEAMYIYYNEELVNFIERKIEYY